MNEHWDDSLPVRYEGRDPYFAYYDSTAGGPIPITNPDSLDKLESFSTWLEQSDYIVLSSQRSVWSTPRLPLTYPMTTRYYDALFNGELGFELVSQFHADLHIGPLYISDVGGEFSWGEPPEIGWPPPGDLAVEEAFSVYDHPPVWLFRKTENYNQEQVRQVLGEVDLSQVTFMTPGQATQAPNGLMLSEAEFEVQRANGTFSNIFNVDGLLARSPALAAVVWWAAVILLGWLVFPLTFVIFRGLPDRGYPLARILSLLLISYFGWLVASLKLLSHTRNTLLLGVILIAILSLTIGWFRRREMGAFVRRNLALIGFVEAFALFLYVAFIIIRLGNPDLWDVIWGGEKPMDLSYFSAILKSTVFPPYDPWFAGGYINYYYYGFVYVGFLTKLLGIVPNIAYNLILPMLFSFTGMGVFSLAYNLVAWKKSREENIQLPNYPINQSTNQPDQPITQPLHRKAIAAGVVAAVLCVFLGNLAEVPLVVSTWNRASTSTLNTGIGPVDAVVHTASGALNMAFSDTPAPIYPGDWFWIPTRVINYRPGEVQPITEFPFFTFLYGDLHAHMIALPLSLLALGWAVSLALQGRASHREGKRGRWSAAVTGLQWVVGGIAIGSLQATNTWDFPTYLFIGILAVAFNIYRQHEAVNLRMVGQAGVQIVALAALSLLTFLPFTQNYGVGYSSFSLWPGSYTHLGVYLLIYGLFLFFVLTHLARELRAWTRTWNRENLQAWKPLAMPVVLLALLYVVVIAFLFIKDYWVAPFVLTLIVLAGLLGLRPNLSPQRRIPLILISSALGLTLLVELIVLDGDIGRMNTVFKFYMQVWVMLSVVGGVAAAMAWPAVQARRNRLSGRIWRYGLALLLAAAVLYPILATKAKWDIRMSAEAPTTLDGMAFMQTTEYQDNGQTVPLHFDYDALQWMRRNIPGSPVVAEGQVDQPYRSLASRVAMFTGLPSILGWAFHQSQQREVVPDAVINNRVADVNALYSTTNTAEALSILEKYEVGYIYVGQLEWVYYTPDGLNKFDSMAAQGLLEEVYRNAGVSIYEVMTTGAVVQEVD
jgi:YYY domain-containing protein